MLVLSLAALSFAIAALICAGAAGVVARHALEFALEPCDCLEDAAGVDDAISEVDEHASEHYRKLAASVDERMARMRAAIEDLELLVARRESTINNFAEAAQIAATVLDADVPPEADTPSAYAERIGYRPAPGGPPGRLQRIGSVEGPRKRPIRDEPQA